MLLLSPRRHYALRHACAADESILHPMPLGASAPP